MPISRNWFSESDDVSPLSNSIGSIQTRKAIVDSFRVLILMASPLGSRTGGLDPELQVARLRANLNLLLSLSENLIFPRGPFARSQELKGTTLLSRHQEVWSSYNGYKPEDLIKS